MANTLIVVTHVVAALGTLGTGMLMIAFGHTIARWISAAYAGLWCILFGTGLILGWHESGITVTEIMSAAGFCCIMLGVYASATTAHMGQAWQRLPQLCGLISFALLIAATAHQALPLADIRFAWWTGALLALTPVCMLAATTIRSQPVRSSAR